MSIFKPTFGAGKRTRHWYVRLTDHRGRRHRIPAFRDRDASEEYDRKLRRLVELKTAGAMVQPDLVRWFENLDPRRIAKLVEIGLVSERQLAAVKPLDEHLTDWRDAIAARGTTPKHVRMHWSRARAVLVDGCGWGSWADVTPQGVVGYLARRRDAGLSGASSNHMLGAVRSFARWMIADGRSSESPLAHLSAVHAARVRRRRPLTADEARRLLAHCAGAGSVLGISGPERALIYRLTMETGLRAKEVRSLRVASFELDTEPPCVRVLAENTKNRREALIPMRARLAELMRARLHGRGAGERALHVPVPGKTALMLRADLEAVEIARIDASGRVVDFHALRSTFSTWLSRSGARTKDHQELMRHSSPVLTLGTYTHGHLLDQARALEGLPDLDANSEGGASRAHQG